MRFLAFPVLLIDGYKTYSAVILLVVSGIGMILTKNYRGGISEAFQVLALVFGGASIVGLRHAVSRLEDASLVGSRHDR